MGACVQKAAKAYWDFLCGEFHKVALPDTCFFAHLPSKQSMVSYMVHFERTTHDTVPTNQPSEAQTFWHSAGNASDDGCARLAPH